MGSAEVVGLDASPAPKDTAVIVFKANMVSEWCERCLIWHSILVYMMIRGLRNGVGGSWQKAIE